MPDYTTGANGHATIEGHLIRNLLGNPTLTPSGYPTRGQYIGDTSRGWSGPYVTSLPKADPWGDKYIINVRNLHAGYLKTLTGDPTNLPKLAVIVISAGPDRNLETRVDQPYDSFAPAGDDIHVSTIGSHGHVGGPQQAFADGAVRHRLEQVAVGFLGILLPDAPAVPGDLPEPDVCCRGAGQPEHDEQ